MATGGFPDNGEFSDRGPAEIIERLVKAKATGELRAYTVDARSRAIDFRNGQVTGVTGNEKHPISLGNMLLVSRCIDRRELEEAEVASRMAGVGLVASVIDSRLLTEHELQQATAYFIIDEILDILSWTSGRYRFIEGDEVHASSAGGAISVIRPVDIRPVLKLFEWSGPRLKELSEFLPKSNSFMRLANHDREVIEMLEATKDDVFLRARERAEDFSPDVDLAHFGKKLLYLVADGWSPRCISLITFVNRMAIFGALGELIRAGLVSPVKEDEIGAFAEELIERKGYEQAIRVCQRMLGSENDPAKRREILANIERCRESIGIVSATEAAEGAARRRELIPASWGGSAGPLLLVLIVLVGVAVFAIPGLRRLAVGADLTAFREADSRAKGLLIRGDHVTAIYEYQKFLAAHPDGDGSELARSRSNELRETYEAMVSAEIRRAGKIEAGGDFARAAAVLEECLDKFPGTNQIRLVQARIGAARGKHKEALKLLDAKQLAERLERAGKLERDGRLTEALHEYTELSSREGGGETGAKAAEGIKRLEVAKGEVAYALRNGRELERTEKLDDAMAEYRRAAKLWPDSRDGRAAKGRLSDIRRRKYLAVALLAEAERLRDGGDIEGALAKCRTLRASCPGMAEAGAAGAMMTELTGVTKQVSALLAAARKLESSGRKDEAFAAFLRLCRRYPESPDVRKLRLTVSIASTPPRASVTVNGKPAGRTPCDIVVRPLQPVRIVLTAPGHRKLDKTIDGIRSPALAFTLERVGLWSFAAGTPVVSAPVVSGGGEGGGLTVFIHCGSEVIAVSGETGGPLWRRAPFEGESPVGSPALHGGHVYSVSASGRIARMSSADGSGGSPFKTGVAGALDILVVRSQLRGGRLLAGLSTGAGSFHVVDLENRSSVGTPAELGGAVAGAHVPLGHLACYLTCGETSYGIGAVDTRTGRVVWKLPLRGVVSTPVSAGAEMLAVAAGGISLVDGRGKVRATKRVPGAELRWPAVGVRSVAAGDGMGAVRAFSLGELDALWTARLDGPVAAAPCFRSGRFYFATRAGTVWCLDEASGNVLWSMGGRGKVTSPLVAGKGALYFGVSGGKLAAVSTE